MGTVVHLEKIRRERQEIEWDAAEEKRTCNGGAIVGVAIVGPPMIALWLFLFWICGAFK